jgi:hypothetical protein
MQHPGSHIQVPEVPEGLGEVPGVEESPEVVLALEAMALRVM